MKRAARWAALLTLISLSAGAQQHAGGKGGHGQGRAWPGIAAHDCGADLHVIEGDGHDTVFWPPETILKQFETEDINQGEEPRRALAVSALLDRYHADVVEFAGCGDDHRRFSADDAKSAMLVLTRRGLFKVVRKDVNGYSNIVTEVKEIKFETVAKQPAAAPAKQPDAGSAKRAGPPPSP